MKTFNYSTTTYTDDSEITLKTNDVSTAAKAFLEAVAADLPCELVSNITGEVLACHSEEADHCVDEMLPVMIMAALELAMPE